MITWNDITNCDITRLDIDVELPADVERVTGLARDAAYAGVGAAVVTARKLEERGRELAGQVTTQVRRLVDSVI